MDIMRAFTYVFDDRDWVNKTLITTIITALSLLLTPLIIGLLGWAALFGYQIELIRNIRLGSRSPLPNWDDFNRYMSSGFNVLTAVIVYNLPNLILGCISTIVSGNLSGGFIGSTLSLGLACCLFPILLIYNLIMLPMLALAMGRYAETPSLNVFFEFTFLFEAVRNSLDKVIQWWLAIIAANIVFVIFLVTVIGWLAIAALLIPVYGMLVGQLALLLLGGLKEKPKNSPLVR
jgi:hypothetical protein